MPGISRMEPALSLEGAVAAAVDIVAMPGRTQTAPLDTRPRCPANTAINRAPERRSRVSTLEQYSNCGPNVQLAGLAALAEPAAG